MSHVSVSLASVQDVFVCRSCLGHATVEVEVTEFKLGDDTLEVVDKFCYLGDMLSSYGAVVEGSEC